MATILFECRSLQWYPLGKDGFHGGTETMVHQLAGGLAGRNHQVHVVTADLQRPEQRGPTLWYWPPESFPNYADVAVAVHGLEHIRGTEAPVLVLAPNGVDPMVGPNGEWAHFLDGVACFTHKHRDLLCEARPTISREKCFITGLGVSLAEYEPNGVTQVPGRLLYANDPVRGLHHLLDIFEHVQREAPEATLHVSYDFERQMAAYQWQANSVAEALWDCKRRIETNPAITNLGALSPADLLHEQQKCQVHVMPSDPPNVGSQIHGMTQMELAAAGAALVLSDVEAFPELFGEAATILPLPGTYLPQLQRRYDAQDWAEAVVQLICDSELRQQASERARQLAAQHTWAHVLDRWEAMLSQLLEQANVAA